MPSGAAAGLSPSAPAATSAGSSPSSSSSPSVQLLRRRPRTPRLLLRSLSSPSFLLPNRSAPPAPKGIRSRSRRIPIGLPRFGCGFGCRNFLRLVFSCGRRGYCFRRIGCRRFGRQKTRAQGGDSATVPARQRVRRVQQDAARPREWRRACVRRGADRRNLAGGAFTSAGGSGGIDRRQG